MGDSLASGLREARQRGGHGEWEVQTFGTYGWGISNPPLVILCGCWGRGECGGALCKAPGGKGQERIAVTVLSLLLANHIAWGLGGGNILCRLGKASKVI